MDNISFKSIVQMYLRNKITFIVVMIIAFALGLTVAFGTPKIYESTTTLATESKESSALGGSMGSLASLAGVNLSKSNDAIVPNLYPSVVATNDFLVGMLNTQVRPKGFKKDITYFEFLQYHQKKSWWVKVIGGLFEKKKNKHINPRKINPQALTKEESTLIESIKGQILCTIDKENDIIDIKAYAQDACVAKQIAETVASQLQVFITNYRTNKSREDLSYYQKLKQEAYQRYVKAQRKYAVYSDSHEDLTLKSYQLESDALENDLQLAYNTYSQACTQVTMAEAKVQERTPVFTVIEKASVEIIPYAPKKKLVVLAYLFVAFVGLSCFFFIKDHKKETTRKGGMIEDRYDEL